MYSNPIKDWFYFTRQQRHGIIILLVLIIVMPLAGKMVSALRRHQDLDEASFLTMLDEYQEHLDRLADLAESQQEASLASTKASKKTMPLRLTPHPFDPNTISLEGWEDMGVSARIGRSIRNFLDAGGRFRYKQDLQRMYLVDDALYAELEPWVTLPDRPARDETGEGYPGGQDRQAHVARKDQAGTGRSGPDQHQDELAGQTPGTGEDGYAHKNQAVNDESGEASHQVASPGHPKRTTASSISVNINKADSTAFQQIRGIGPVFSRRIVRYRELLGGYYCTSQLLEVFGMDSTRYADIQDFIEPDTLLIQRINLNTASFGDLVRHPYIDQPVASAILSLREQHGPFACPADIKSSYLIDESSWERLRPYLHAGKDEDHK